MGSSGIAAEEPSSACFTQLATLWETIQERKATCDSSSSYTAKLLKKGPEKCAQKVGEEATEVVIEATARRQTGMVKESADLLYHLFVLWAAVGVNPSEVMEELARREGTSGIAEKAARPNLDLTRKLSASTSDRRWQDPLNVAAP